MSTIDQACKTIGLTTAGRRVDFNFTSFEPKAMTSNKAFYTLTG